MALSPNLAVMERALEKAARSLLRDFNEVEKLQISTKGPGDFVSRADKRSEEIIVESLVRDRPEWGILAEEGTAIIGKDDRYRLIIDPLDGTRNFLHGVPHWCITAALEKDGEIIAGMTLDPLRQEVFRVEKGAGAFMNNTRLRVSGRKELNTGVFAIYSGLRNAESLAAYSDVFTSLNAEPGAAIRMNGAMALDLAYVAAGRYDGYYLQGGAKPWDIATGILLVREASGIVTDLSFRAAHHSKGDMLAGSAIMHKKLAEKLKLSV